MVQICGSFSAAIARLVLEALPRFGVGREGPGKDLDGDRAIEPGVAPAVDLAHAASAERRDEFVRAESRACVKGHCGACILAWPGKSRYSPA